MPTSSQALFSSHINGSASDRDPVYATWPQLTQENPVIPPRKRVKASSTAATVGDSSRSSNTFGQGSGIGPTGDSSSALDSQQAEQPTQFAEYQPKKRGRPSKAEVEARNAEAIARGEVIPPPRVFGARNPQLAQSGARSLTPTRLGPTGDSSSALDSQHGE
jgi:hypothetical protein